MRAKSITRNHFASFKDKGEDTNPAALTAASLCLPSSMSPETPAATHYMRALKSTVKKQKTYLLNCHAATKRFGITLVAGFELSLRTCQLSVRKSLNPK